MRVHFCASRFLLKVLATLASGSERQRVTAQSAGSGYFPLFFTRLAFEWMFTALGKHPEAIATVG
jgi:hypothetical protein